MSLLHWKKISGTFVLRRQAVKDIYFFKYLYLTYICVCFKSSKDILLAISRDFLSGEGDLSRHLGFLGLPVSHIQTPLDEFDFAVTNLAVDLQCGIRLVYVDTELC